MKIWLTIAICDRQEFLWNLMGEERRDLCSWWLARQVFFAHLWWEVPPWLSWVVTRKGCNELEVRGKEVGEPCAWRSVEGFSLSLKVGVEDMSLVEDSSSRKLMACFVVLAKVLIGRLEVGVEGGSRFAMLMGMSWWAISVSQKSKVKWCGQQVGMREWATGRVNGPKMSW